MIAGSREEHMAENEITNKDYMLEETEYDEAMKEKEIEYDDSKDGWVEKENVFQQEFVPDPADEGRIFLTEYELARINLNAEKHKAFEKEKKMIDMKVQLIKTQQALLDAKKETLERDMMIVEYHAIQNTKASEEFKDESKQFLLDISKQHTSLKGKQWGYNPESGEIVVDDK